MALPTSYDKNQFAYYLYSEVLQSVADTMGWLAEAGTVKTPVTGLALKTDGAAVPDMNRLRIDPLAHEMNPADVIQFDGDDNTYTAAMYHPVGARMLYVFPSVVDAIPDNTDGEFTFSNINATHPVYESILDEALLIMGLTSITQVSGINAIQRLRMIGKIEAWRAVMSNVAGDISASFEGVKYSRGKVFELAKEQLELALEEYSRVAGAVSVTEPLTRPVFQRTRSTKVRANW